MTCLIVETSDVKKQQLWHVCTEPLPLPAAAAGRQPLQHAAQSALGVPAASAQVAPPGP